MTSIEFKSWLLGYLEDKDALKLEHIELIRNKIKTIQEPIEFNPIVPLHPVPTPINPYPPYNPTRPDPGTTPWPGHDIWYGTTTTLNNLNTDGEMDKQDIGSKQEKND